ncbi:glycosyl transferase family 90 [Vibrio atlanticus]|uniref:glycosyl transferase family 90 n=1 Tax=Vibrio atlanticus TaxID=693153 RepID=UPI0022B05CB5|nr:glycosyl transferase family 90 [Vibrio atlanticus]MCZ4310070.1 glycosyl transferase family 90 [Vibrio atlanticus]
MKIFYYLKHALLSIAPRLYFSTQFEKLETSYSGQTDYIKSRVNYYVKGLGDFDKASLSCEIKNYARKGYTSYFFDLKEFLHYFPKYFRFSYYFGDETHIEPVPTLFKARPIDGNNSNSVLFKLDKRRHFRFVDDSLSFSDKKNMAVFRGAVTQPHRIRFMETLYGHPLMNAGQSNTSEQHPEWQQPFMTVEEQLQYKFIICLEGNDVASNLKWAMSSNSLVVTPKMKFETWFMEGTLQPGIHYVEVKDDWSDFEQKIKYYLDNPKESEQMIKNAHEYLAPFQDEQLEKLVCIKTLQEYFRLSGQAINEHAINEQDK